MRRLRVAWRSHGERGATAVVAALVMTVLLGFAGLAIDLGASYAKHAELQNGADAAALALAQEYALDGCSPNSDMATTWVRSNVKNDVAGAEATATCPEVNQVTVAAEATQEHWFMPVLGRDSSDIAADATVSWGVPVAGQASLPIAFSQCSFEHRVDGIDVPIDGTIAIWMDHPSDPFGDACNEDYPPGGFGWLIPEGGKCNSWIEPGPPPVGYGIGRSKPGTPQPDECVADNAFKRAVDSDEPVLIPIFNEAPGNGNGAPIHIVKFAAFDLKGYVIHNKLGSYNPGLCKSKPSPELKTCLTGEFVKYVDFAEGMELAPPTSGDETIIIKLID